ncbi:Nuclear hormone receptor HR96 [Strongyloides ratti]|uniref:Nuclear hormone receptor HR96 n=2 Tax=Strongyloides ratti TaxID=34506 RepID=A0A090L178_STRRB|nr:Nuclear hormone receptor HR96 [Strongyloides ratti]CEF61194.1 Nuclear hormone receptor HR96 [Strongyloides ratti]
MNLDNQPNGAALLLAAAAMTRSLNAADVTHLFSSNEAKLILEEHARNVHLQEQLNIKNQKNQKTKKKNVSKTSYQNNNSIAAVVAHLASNSDTKKDISYDNSTPLNSNTCSPTVSEPDTMGVEKKDLVSFSPSNNLANDENDILTSNNDTLNVQSSNKWSKRKINDKVKVDGVFEDNIIGKKNNEMDVSSNRVPHHRIKDRRKVTLEIMRKISAEQQMNTPDDPVIHSPNSAASLCQNNTSFNMASLPNSSIAMTNNGSSFNNVFQPQQGLASPNENNSNQSNCSNSNCSANEGDTRRRQKTCRVCGDHATGYNFNVITCESCKAFFRRNALRPKEFKCPYSDDCEINSVSRRFCQKCRLKKCFQVGMKKEWILNEEQLRRRKNSRLNHMARNNNNNNNNHINPNNMQNGCISGNVNNVNNVQNLNNSLANGFVVSNGSVGNPGVIPPSMEQLLLNPSSVNSAVLGQQNFVSSNMARVIPNQSNLALLSANLGQHILMHNNRRNPGDLNSRNVGIIQQPNSDMMSPETSITPNFNSQIVSGNLLSTTSNIIKQESIIKPDISPTVNETNLSGNDGRFNSSPFQQTLSGISRPNVSVQPQPQISQISSTSPIGTIVQDNGEPKVTLSLEQYNQLVNAAKNTTLDTSMIIKQETHTNSPSDLEAVSNVVMVSPTVAGYPTIPSSFEDNFSVKTERDYTLSEKDLKELDSIRDSFQCMNEPLDNDQQASTLAKKEHNPTDILNVMDITMRRLVKMAKRLGAFNEISEAGKFSLLKGGMIEMLTIRGVTVFNADKGVWQTPVDGHSQISFNMFDKLRPDIKDTQKKGFLHFFNLLHSDVRKNDLAIDIIVLMVLFDSKREGLVSQQDKETVEKLHRNYESLLHRYLYSIHKDEAEQRFASIPKALVALRKVAENAVTLFLGTGNTTEAASLPKEFFATNY